MAEDGESMASEFGIPLLAKVHYEKLDNGRVKCIETGHEMPEAHARDYASTKKCKAALFEKGLSENKVLKKFFRQSSLDRDKIVCQLTGAVLNKTEKAVWKHMAGKKFLRALDEKEDLKEEKAPEEEEPTLPASDSSEPDFWVPPVGDRWDMDDGGDRWTSSSSAGSRMISSRRVEGLCDEEEEDVAAMEELEDEPMDTAEGNQSPDNDQVRIKRTALALGPSGLHGKRKKKRKPSRKDTS